RRGRAASVSAQRLARGSVLQRTRARRTGLDRGRHPRGRHARAGRRLSAGQTAFQYGRVDRPELRHRRHQQLEPPGHQRTRAGRQLSARNGCFDMNLLDELQELLGPSAILTGAETHAYTQDWRERYDGRALAVVRPASTEEVAAVV